MTVHIERLTSEEYDEHDMSGIPELIESIKLQDTGPTEASRAIRKKLCVQKLIIRGFIRRLADTPPASMETFIANFARSQSVPLNNLHPSLSLSL